MRSSLAAWLFIAAAFVFLAIGAFGAPRRPAYTTIGIALFIVGFVARRRGRRGGNQSPQP